jgi:uncharacterized protein DUF397
VGVTEGHEMTERNVVKWRRSSRCSNNACVEVAKVDAAYLVRDSKNPEGAVLSFSEDEWKAFAAGVAAGDFRW